MSVDSLLFVACNKEDVLAIGASVTKALSEYSRDKLDDFWKNNTECENRMQFLCADKYIDIKSKYTNGAKVDSHDFESFWIIFGNGDSVCRSLFMTTSCSSDYSEIYDGHKVIFSIGCWDSYDEIMAVVADAVKPYGDVYYDYNDCDDKYFIKL